MLYKDKIFCASEVEEHTCGREFTEEDEKGAREWWGSDNYPVAFGDFCNKLTSKE